MLSLRVKLYFLIMGADLLMALLLAVAHSRLCFLFVILACIVNVMGDETYKYDINKEKS